MSQASYQLLHPASETILCFLQPVNRPQKAKASFEAVRFVEWLRLHHYHRHLRVIIPLGATPRVLLLSTCASRSACMTAFFRVRLFTRRVMQLDISSTVNLAGSKRCYTLRATPCQPPPACGLWKPVLPFGYRIEPFLHYTGHVFAFCTMWV